MLTAQLSPTTTARRQNETLRAHTKPENVKHVNENCRSKQLEQTFNLITSPTTTKKNIESYTLHNGVNLNDKKNYKNTRGEEDEKHFTT
jgi:hypothetical protein